MRKIFSCLALLFLLLNCTYAFEVESYYKKKCAGCHGTTGEIQSFGSDVKIATGNRLFIFMRLKQLVKEYDKLERGPKKSMIKQFKDLDDEALKDLSKYVKSLGEKK